MGNCCFFVVGAFEPTLRFLKVREVFAENGIDVGASSSIRTSGSGVLCRDVADDRAFGLGISSSRGDAGDRPPEGDVSGVEYGPVDFPASDLSRPSLRFFTLIPSSGSESKS